MQKLYFGGSIITMENEDDRPEALLVENGKILAVGELREVIGKADSKVINVDLQGKCMMPSFIDTHSHISMNGLMSGFVDLSECKSFNDITCSLKQYILEKKVTSKGLVIGVGYDHNFLLEETHPTAEILDVISLEVPILLIHTSGHMGCVNAAAMKIMGVNADTKDPQGGRLGRKENTNIPNGYLEESAMIQLTRKLKSRIKFNVLQLMERMQAQYIENGVTTAQDGATNKMILNFLKIVNAINKLQIDVIAYIMMEDITSDIIFRNKKYKNYHKHLKIGGYKLILDGSPQGRSAWMREPYLLNDEEYCGYGLLQEKEVCQYMLKAVNESKQILVHCNGDAASEQCINAYKHALQKSTNANKKDLRPVMIHCQTVQRDQLKEMAKINMVASIFVGHVYYWGDVHLKNLGDIRGNYISPVKDALDLGVSVNFHQDTPVTKPNMLHSVWCAVNRKSRTGRVIGEHQTVDVYEALKAVTISAAYQYGEEDSKGSIKVGKRADLVILSDNPLKIEKLKIDRIQVLETIKDGKSIYKR